MKKQVVVIGLGRLGAALASTLSDIGHDVLAIDPDEALVLDVAGRQMLVCPLAPGQTVMLDCTGLPAGCYFVTLRHHVRCPVQTLVVLGD